MYLVSSYKIKRFDHVSGFQLRNIQKSLFERYTKSLVQKFTKCLVQKYTKRLCPQVQGYTHSYNRKDYVVDTWSDI
jgi:hypothetical protein